MRFLLNKPMSQPMSHPRSSKLILRSQILISLNQQRTINQISEGSSIENIIGNINEGVVTRSRENIANSWFISKIEPENFKEALTDEFWINTMQEERFQFERNKLWELVSRPGDVKVFGTKWIYKNKFDESGDVIRNKARLVAQGYT